MRCAAHRAGAGWLGDPANVTCQLYVVNCKLYWCWFVRCPPSFGFHTFHATLHVARHELRADGCTQICDAGGFTVLNVTDPILQRMFDVFR